MGTRAGFTTVVATLALAGCGGGGEVVEDAPTRSARRGSDSDVMRLPDPLASAVNIAPEDSLTPPQLVEVLGEADHARRMRAHDRLVRAGGDALSALLEGLKSAHPSVRSLSAHAIGLLGEPADGVVEGLIEALDAAGDAADVRRHTLWALGRLRVQDSGGLVAEIGAKAFFYLDDADPGVRSHAAETIRRLHYQDAVVRLIGLLHPDTEGYVADPVGQQHIRDALRDITFVDFGTDPQQWAAWLAGTQEPFGITGA